MNKPYQNPISGTVRKGMLKYNIMSTDQENIQHYLNFVGRQTDIPKGVGWGEWEARNHATVISDRFVF